MHIVLYGIGFCGLPGPQEKMTLPCESEFWMLFYHTWGMSAHAHYIAQE